MGYSQYLKKKIYAIDNVETIRFLKGPRKKKELKISFRGKPFDIRNSINNSIMYCQFLLGRFSKYLSI